MSSLIFSVSKYIPYFRLDTTFDVIGCDSPIDGNVIDTELVQFISIINLSSEFIRETRRCNRLSCQSYDQLIWYEQITVAVTYGTDTTVILSQICY